MDKYGDEQCVDSTQEDSVNKLIQPNCPPRGYQLPGPAPGSGTSFVCLERPTFNLNYYPQMVPPGYPYPCWPADHHTPGFVIGAVPQCFPTMVYGLGSVPPPIPINATGRFLFQQYSRQMDGARGMGSNRDAGVEYADNTPNTMTPEIEGMPRITSLNSQPNSPEFGHQVAVKTIPQNSIRSNRSIPIVQQNLPVVMDKRSDFVKNQAGDRDRCSETSPTVFPKFEGKQSISKNHISQKMRENHTSANFADIASRARGMPSNCGSTPQGVQLPKPPNMGEMRLKKTSPQRFSGPSQFHAPLQPQQGTPSQLECGKLSDAVENMKILSQPSSSIGSRAGPSRIEPEFPKILRVTSNSSCSSTSLEVLAEKKTPADSCGESPNNDDQSDAVRNTHGSRKNTMKNTCVNFSNATSEVLEISETSIAPLSNCQEDESSEELKERAQILYELGNRTVPSLGGSIRCYSAKNTESAFANAEKSSFPSFQERELFRMPVERNSLSMKSSFTLVEKSPLTNRSRHSISAEGGNMPAMGTAFTLGQGSVFTNRKRHRSSITPGERSSMSTDAFMKSTFTNHREQCLFRRSHPPLESQNFVASVSSKIFGEICQHTHMNDEECRMMLEPPEQVARSLSPDDSGIYVKSEIPDEISTSPSSMLQSNHSSDADYSDTGFQNNMPRVFLTKRKQLYATGASDTDSMVTHFPDEPDVVVESGDSDDESCYTASGEVLKTPLQTDGELTGSGSTKPFISSKMENKDSLLPHAQPGTNSDTTQQKLKKDNRVAGFVCKFCRRCFPILNLISDHFVSDHFRDVSTLEAAFGLRYQPVICETCSCPFALCSYCGEAYYSEKGVKKHIQIHKLQKTFKCTYCNKTLERKTHNLHLLVHKGVKPYCGSCNVPFPQSSPSKDNRRLSSVGPNKQDSPTTRNDNEPCRKSVVAVVGTPNRRRAGKNSARKLGAKRLIVLVERLETCNAASVQDLIDGSYKGPIKHKNPHSVVNFAKSKKSSTSEITNKIARNDKDSIALGCEVQTPPSGKTGTSNCLSNIAVKQVDDNVGQIAEGSEESTAVQLEGTTPSKNEISNRANDVTSDPESEEILIFETSYVEALNCEICGKTFEFLSELSDHMPTHYDGNVTGDSASPPEPTSSLFQRFSCEVCGIDYDDLEIMSEHMKEHTLAVNLPDLTQDCQDESGKPGLVQRYYCELCSIDFDDVKILTQHMEEHIANEPEIKYIEPLSETTPFKEVERFLCKICGIDYDDPKILSKHMEEHTKESSDDECEFVIADNSQQEVKTQDIQPCSICKKNVKDLKRHMKTHGKKKHACEICGLNFVKKITLKKHIKTHMKNTQVEEKSPSIKKFKHSCKYCRRFFSNRERLEKHQGYDCQNKKFVCEICTKRFGNKGGLQMHKSVHISYKKAPNICQFCNNAFNTVFMHRNHEKICQKRNQPEVFAKSRSENMLSKCQFCSKVFFSKIMLKNHTSVCQTKRMQEQNHPKVRKREFVPRTKPLKKFTCRLCGRKITTPVRFQNHMSKVHSLKTLPFNRDQAEPLQDLSCRSCDKAFTTHVRFQNHMTIVHRLKSLPYNGKFVCKTCGRKFTYHAFLQKHVASEHGK